MAWLYGVVKLSAKENKYNCYIQKYPSFKSVAVKIYGTTNFNSAVEQLLVLILCGLTKSITSPKMNHPPPPPKKKLFTLLITESYVNTKGAFEVQE